MRPQNWVNISSGNGLLFYGTKPLPESRCQIISDVLWHSSKDFTGNGQEICPSHMSLQITNLISQLDLPDNIR